MAHSAEIIGSSIVAIGTFNPAIFSPDWLERHALVGKDDADAAREGESLLVSPQVSNFETGWFVLQVLTDRFTLTSKDVLSPAFKDLAVGIFQLVPHTPVAAVGLNFMAHFKLDSEDDFHRVGDELAPKELWNELYPGEMAGLQNLTILIQHGTRGEPRKTKDEKRITVEPSKRIKFGVYLAYNDHYDLGGTEKTQRTVASIVDEGWQSAWQDSIRVFDGVLSRILRK